VSGLQTGRAGGKPEKHPAVLPAAWLASAISHESEKPVLVGTAGQAKLEGRISSRTLNLLLLAALVLAIVFATALGAVRLPLSEVVASLLHPSRAGDAGEIIF